MKNTLITILIALFISISCFAQQGINYKALIKDTNGNALVSTDIPTVKFVIYKGAALTENVYEETHTPTTDANGIIIVTIGTGTTTDVFADIDWESDEHWLNVKIDIGDGIEDISTTQFMAVPYALSAGNVSGLEALDEGEGIGWRLKGKNPISFGPIGFSAVDLSYGLSETDGATGDYSVAMGWNVHAVGDYSMAFGSALNAVGKYSSAFGYFTRASSFASTAIGQNNIGSLFGNRLEWVATDALFEIGNGLSPSARSNALTVLKDGTTTVNNISDSNPDLILGGISDTEENGIISSDPQFSSSDIFIKSNDKVQVYLDNDDDEESTFSIIDGSGTGVFQVAENGTITASGFDLSEIIDDKALITKEYADINLGNSGLEQITELNSVTGLMQTGWRLRGVDPSLYGTIGNYAIDLSIIDGYPLQSGAKGAFSFAAGSYSSATGHSSISIGSQSVAGGTNAVAFGSDAEALGDNSLAIGKNTSAAGDYSTALGRANASGNYSTALGFSFASGDNSTALGNNSSASGNSSTAMGSYTKAPSFAETAIGRFNTEYTLATTNGDGALNWNSTDRLFVIGNGESYTQPNNALTVLKNGNAIFDAEIQRPDTGNADMIPIAYGTVESNANVLSGTGNFSATISSGVITITISNENLTVFNSACTVVPYGGNPRFSTLTYISNKLEVRVFNSSGNLTPTTFQFVLYKL